MTDKTLADGSIMLQQFELIEVDYMTMDERKCGGPWTEQAARESMDWRKKNIDGRYGYRVQPAGEWSFQDMKTWTGVTE